ncbi:DUF2600 family protein [Thermaerobacter marianensis]|uniref:DUF2600 family protein n=1 Tax=Thermaerobacter marianensis TaxID=73919 RepID=UPI001FA6EE7D|nr:DUF2600 family protein [Thermaerobacter marianensis]
MNPFRREPGPSRDADSPAARRRSASACEAGGVPDVGEPARSKPPGGARRLLAEAARLATYVGRVLPAVDRALDRWQARAALIPDPELRRQALASLRTKRFHCEGGAVFAAAVPPDRRATLVEAIVALQTISDYLDNLCDRSESLDPADYRQLHQAMLDAVTPWPAQAPASVPRRAVMPPPHRGQAPLPSRAEAPLPRLATVPAPHRGAPPSADEGTAGSGGRAYYRLHPHQDDGGYLAALVTSCRTALAAFPGYHAVASPVRRLVALYNDLQVNKHGDQAGRLPRLEAWYHREAGRWHGRLAWWEFAAACGSTLGVFALFREALLHPAPPAERVAALVDAYFPWIGGLHILLDYLIDQAEDRAGGDLNLVRPYGDPSRAVEGLAAFAREAARRAEALPDAPLHRLVVDGLLGLYLTDPKVARQHLQPVARRLLAAGGPGARMCFAASRFVRRWRGNAG